jgi:hypothetical protein
MLCASMVLLKPRTIPFLMLPQSLKLYNLHWINSNGKNICYSQLPSQPSFAFSIYSDMVMVPEAMLISFVIFLVTFIYLHPLVAY